MRLGEAVDLGVLELVEFKLLGAVAVLRQVSQPVDLLVSFGGSGDLTEDSGVVLQLEVEALAGAIGLVRTEGGQGAFRTMRAAGEG